MNPIRRVLSAPTVLGAGAGFFVLHPLAMAAVSPPRAVPDLGSFHPGMIPMALAFVGAGVALAWALHVLAPPHADAGKAPGGAFARTCMYCKAMPVAGPDGREIWLPLEQALLQSYDLTLSHGICPHCMDAVVEPELRALRERRGGPLAGSGTPR
ncbi:hypothetical protein [Deferrisoma palaeochoriense]